MTKLFIWLGMFIGSTAFGAIPMLWGDDYFSAASIGLSFVGALLGTIGGWKLGQMVSF
jgi:hypothetical protein